MNRYDHQFRNLEAHLRAIPANKLAYAKDGLFQHRANGFGQQDDEAIVRQFDLSGMAEFWEIELSEPMKCVDFVRSLARHFYTLDWRPDLNEEEAKQLGPAAERINNSVKTGIRQALRDARSYDEPWFTVIPEPPKGKKLDHRAALDMLPDTVFVLNDPPVDGIDLNKLRVRPRSAVEWMLASAQRRHLVPPSLAKYIVGDKAVEPQKNMETSKRGRPKGTSYSVFDGPIAQSALELLKRGEAKSATDAVWSLIGRDGKGAEGSGQPESKVERIVQAVNRLKAAEDNRVKRTPD